MSYKLQVKSYIFLSLITFHSIELRFPAWTVIARQLIVEDKRAVMQVHRTARNELRKIFGIISLAITLAALTLEIDVATDYFLYSVIVQLTTILLFAFITYKLLTPKNKMKQV